MSLSVVWTATFKRDYKRAMRRRLPMEELDGVIGDLAEGRPLALIHRDHALVGRWSGYRECHIRPDWLLIYKIEQNTLVLSLARTGTHSDLFDE